MARRLRVRSVDDRGVSLGAIGEGALDVLFDDRRVWSFWAPRDTEPDGPLGRLAAWPGPLRRYLDGTTVVTLRDPGTEEIHFRDSVDFGSGEGDIRVVNKEGIDLGVDKSGRLVPTFETRDRGDIDALVRATVAVLDSLRTAGVQPFVAYGTLLGAVREQAVLGHDSDADVAYVSDYHEPVDVVRESFRLQREVHELGFETVRYSGAAFKVLVPEADGIKRGLDVFAGFFDDGRLWLMGEVGVAFERAWIHPLGTAVLEGVEVPVPARPEKLLEAMYGPGWKVPDPSFQFTTSRAVHDALNEWFRGLRPGFKYWQRRYALRKRHKPRRGPARLARQARREARRIGATSVLDVGAGKGADSLWLARNGVSVVAYDYVTMGLDFLDDEIDAEHLPLEVRELNLTELRSVLGEGARLAHLPGPRVVMAQHLLDAIGPRGCENFARFCSLVLRDGGTLLAQFFIDQAATELEWTVGQLDVETVEAQLRGAGAHTVRTTPVPRDEEKLETVWVMAQWGA